VQAATAEGITHAMVVPTMLGRILDQLDGDGVDAGGELASLRSLSYGGGPMPPAVIERAVQRLPHVGFVNAYGLTETSSTIAVLGPEDHRIAMASDDPVVRRRLTSVGRPLPSIELSIRDAEGNPVGPGERGEIWVSGPQVSGEYLGRDTGDGGWFNTRDAGEQDEEGYLYIHGRLDDVIVRGGENLSPGEIEHVLVDHPSIEQAAVVGIPDVEWGERVVAAVVPLPGATVDENELRDFVRARLRSTRTPERIDVRDELPTNETGKVLRRVLRDELAKQFG
jgi:acyl-CoA synthetase (AMP-forming)/AMP-acid ligase II